MKVRVAYTVSLGRGYRRAIRHYYGQSGLASRLEITAWFMNHGSAMNDTLRHEHGACCWGDPAVEHTASVTDRAPLAYHV